MRFRILLPLLLLARAGAEDGFTPLFNGRNLDGWDGDPRLWKVAGGEIVGSTEGVTLDRNTFLISKRSYKNFIFRTQMKLRNHNSGIQFRSKASPDWVVGGYQVDAAENAHWGNIYEERGKRGIMVNTYREKGSKAVRHNDWNDVEIRCEGDRIRVTLNGTVTAELQDSVSLEGVIAFQLHRGDPMEARFRNIRIRELP